MASTQMTLPGAVPAALPANETERIRKLLSYQVLDTASEKSYDDIAEMAAYICDTPTSLVTLVDSSRQWFKSKVGLEATETPRDSAFCAHAILKPEVLVVPDALEDKRFATNPLVTGAPHIRFYAGAPLITTDGYALGTICVIDEKPKQLSAKQIQALEALARQVVTQLESRLAVVRIQKEVTKQQASELALRQANQELETRTETIYQKNQQLENAYQQLHLTQSQLIHQEKMASLGQLVAGIAHEINNPVSFIYGNLGHLNNYTRDLLDFLALYEAHCPHPTPQIQLKAQELDLVFLKKDIRKMLSSMAIGAERIQEIVLSLRNFSRLDEAGHKVVDIHEGLESTLLILQHRFKAQTGQEAIAITRDFGDLPRVDCCAGQINQVFMSILSNAVDALESDAATLVNGLVQKQKTPQIAIRTEARAQSVVISIADNGGGIPLAVKDQIFNPFFTTKEVGKGTGMGLAISYQLIVETHRGRIECFSDEGVGTTFEIEIPVSFDLVGDR